MQWFYRVGDLEYGPVPSANLKALAARGAIGRKTPVRREIDDAWSTADQVNGLFANSEVRVTPPPPPPANNLGFPAISETKQPQLTQCPACDHQVSVKAKACPSCGHPLSEIPVLIEKTAKRWKRKKMYGAVLTAVGLFAASSAPHYANWLCYVGALICLFGLFIYVMASMAAWWDSG